MRTDKEITEAYDERFSLRDVYELGRADAVANGVLEQIISGIVAHDAEHPDHGVGCACHDGQASKIRRLMAQMPEKSRDNLRVVIGYVMRHPY